MTDLTKVVDAVYGDVDPEAYDGDLAGLLERTRAYFARYVVVAEPVPSIVALWVAHTYLIPALPVSPYVYFYSPEPGSGKTTALDVLQSVACGATRMDGMSASVLFRVIDMGTPTLLLDELDAIFTGKPSESGEAIRAVLNAGYRIGGYVWRVEVSGKSYTPKRFSVYCPKAMAGLKPLPPSLAHRAIAANLKPALATEQHDDFENDDDDRLAEADALTKAWAAWAAVAVDDVTARSRKPDKLEDLDARQNEIARPLLRIADVAGGRWPLDARAGLVTLLVGDDVQAASAGRELLTAIRDAFDSHYALQADRLTCREVADALNADDHYGYATWNNGTGVTTREVGRKLAAYGIRARTVRHDDARGEGYHRDQFEDAWQRYCPPYEDDDEAMKADW